MCGSIRAVLCAACLAHLSLGAPSLSDTNPNSPAKSLTEPLVIAERGTPVAVADARGDPLSPASVASDRWTSILDGAAASVGRSSSAYHDEGRRARRPTSFSTSAQHDGQQDSPQRSLNRAPLVPDHDYRKDRRGAPDNNERKARLRRLADDGANNTAVVPADDNILGDGHFEGDGHDHEDDHDSHDEHDSHDDHYSHGDHDSHNDHHDNHGDHDSHDSHAHSSSEARAEGQPLYKPWKEVILSTLVINVATLVGIIILAPGVGRARHFCLALFTKNRRSSDLHQGHNSNQNGHGKAVDIAIPSFAAGALLAAAVFLILPESIAWIQRGAEIATEADPHGHGDEDHDDHGHRFLQDGHEGHDDHGDEIGATWRFGASVLGGFLLPMVLGALFPRSSEHVCDDECGESPGLRSGAVAEALVPISPRRLVQDRDNGEEDEHCCQCAVEAMERGAGASIPENDIVEIRVSNDGEGAGVDVNTVVSNCPTCDEEACCTGSSGSDAIDESGTTKKSVTDEEKSSSKSHDHDDHSDCGANNHCHDNHSCDDKFNDEIADRTSERLGDHAPKSKSKRSLRSSFVSVCRHGVGHARTGRNIRTNVNYRLCASILIGDGFHNFADGIFIGIGFLLCDRAVAVSILAVTLYHEVAQELADFFLLTKHAGLGVWSALALNFASGLSVVLGGIVILAVDLTAQAVGVVLAIAAGVYIQIAASECIPRVDAAIEGWKDRMLSLLMFVVGAVPIGLALLNHKHCEG